MARISQMFAFEGFTRLQLVRVDFFLLIEPLEHLLPQRVGVCRMDHHENPRGNTLVFLLVRSAVAALREDRQLLLQVHLEVLKATGNDIGSGKELAMRRVHFRRIDLRTAKTKAPGRDRCCLVLNAIEPAALPGVRSDQLNKGETFLQVGFEQRLILVRWILRPGQHRPLKVFQECLHTSTIDWFRGIVHIRSAFREIDAR